MSFIFEEGTEVPTGGGDGQHSYDIANGEPVLDVGGSNFVFVSGTGLGGSESFRAILRDSPGGNVIADIKTTADGLYGDGGFGMVWNDEFQVADDGKGYWDNFVKSDGTVIDQFTDGDLSEYKQDLDNYTVSGGRAQNVVEENNGGSWWIYSDPGDGLNSYPKVGDDWTYEVEFNGRAEVCGCIFGVQRGGYENDGSDPSTGDNNEPNCLEVSPRPGNGDFIIRQWDNADGTFLAQENVNWSNYTNQLLEVEIQWR